ncbi:MAG: phospholipid/cholesterol/gamma-HCH transport system substrate-binding protein [Saprospiraceae bacterium]|jgi:phospholipid/cholesterol/gamma-HCH transport system substrate-binding protein
MGKERTNTIKLGLFVMIALILFTVAIFYIGNTQNIFGDSFRISTIFKNVNGLQSGSNVRYSGINVGIVDKLVIVNDSTIRVDMNMQKEVQRFLKKNAIASIGTDGLVGNMIVNINPGIGNSSTVENGDRIESYTRVEAGEMLNTLGNTTENIALLTLNLLEIAENINKGEGSIATLLNDRGMATDLQLAIRNLRYSTQHINTLSGQFQESMDSVSQGKGLLGYLLNDSTFELQINQITAGLDSLIRSRTVPIMDNLEQSSTDIATTSAELKNMIRDIDLNQGLIGTVLKDSILVEDLKETMHNLNEGTDRFNENMEALKHNFLFRKYFKKEEKRRKKELKKQQEDSVVRR